jgi:hypothetical protein
MPNSVNCHGLSSPKLFHASPHGVLAARQSASLPRSARRLQRFASWIRALMTDDGIGARFATQRRHDALMRRVERQNRH